MDQQLGVVHEHLDAANSALRVSFEESLTAFRTPLWFGFAAIGPALVLWRQTWWPIDGSERVANLTQMRSLAAVCGLVAVLSIVAHLVDGGRRVLPLAPVHGGQLSKWLFAASMAISFSITMPMMMSDFYDYRLLALGSYLSLALLPQYLYKRHAAVQMVQFS